jgi:hypothetical protein
MREHDIKKNVKPTLQTAWVHTGLGPEIWANLGIDDDFLAEELEKRMKEIVTVDLGFDMRLEVLAETPKDLSLHMLHIEITLARHLWEIQNMWQEKEKKRLECL